MKSLGGGQGGRILRVKALKAEECIRYTLSQPISTLVSGIDSMKVLESNLKIASKFVPMSEEEEKEILDRAEPHSKNGKYEYYKN
jgi:predicted aldo/keto reductase-like oxidoreductase